MTRTSRQIGWALGLFTLFLLAAGCGGSSDSNSSPTAPSTPTPTPEPATTYLLRGVVQSGDTGNLAGATVAVIDGIGAGLSVKTAASGAYEMTLPSAGSFTARITAAGHVTITQPFTLSADTPARTWDVTLFPVAIWRKAGKGNAKFTIPSYVHELKMEGTYHGRTSSLWKLRVNDLTIMSYTMGTTPWDSFRTTFSSTLGVGPGSAEVVATSDIDWSITEVRWLPTLSRQR